LSFREPTPVPALLGLARKTPFAILNPVKFRMRVQALKDRS
jgi:hypothetical protein